MAPPYRVTTAPHFKKYRLPSWPLFLFIITVLASLYFFLFGLHNSISFLTSHLRNALSISDSTLFYITVENPACFNITLNSSGYIYGYHLGSAVPLYTDDLLVNSTYSYFLPYLSSFTDSCGIALELPLTFSYYIYFVTFFHFVYSFIVIFYFLDHWFLLRDFDSYLRLPSSEEVPLHTL